jgi:hypothetical protein
MTLQDNEREIQPIQTWVNGEVKTMTLLRIDNYLQYDFLMNPGMVHYCLCGYEELPQTDYDGNPITVINKPTYVDGNIQLTWELVNQWGEDDTIIFDYVINELNLILI